MNSITRNATRKTISPEPSHEDIASAIVRANQMRSEAFWDLLAAAGRGITQAARAVAKRVSTVLSPRARRIDADLAPR